MSRAGFRGRGRSLLVLSDGSVFEGNSFGASGVAGEPVVGELVFNTSMTGYQEAVTDPSYAGQLLLFSYPLIGNYGVSEGAFESDRVHCRAVIAREACNAPVHYESRGSFHEFLEEQGVPGIEGVDTRAIVKKIRSAGVMPSALVQLPEGTENHGNRKNELVEQTLEAVRKFDYGAIDFVQQAATPSEITYGQQHSEKIVLVDCGCKQSIVRELLKRSLQVIVVPPTTSAKRILEHKPDGVVVSNGPGDPALMQYAIRELRELLGKTPVFGICLGHQILGHALGAKTFKLKFGHRGSNHPVQNTETGRVFISAQNHGYAVHELPPSASEWFVNSNDGTNEGLRADKLGAISVQYHPEANPGPYDNTYLFNEFLKTIW